MANRYLEALQENVNLLGLASAVGVAAAFVTPIPLLVGFVAEAIYLIFVPDSSWYANRLSRRHDDEVRARQEELKAKTLPGLRASLRERFAKLEQTRREIDAAATGDAEWMREVLRKLDFLLEKFLQFAVKDEQFRVYLYESRLEIDRQRGQGQFQPVRLVTGRGQARSQDLRTLVQEPTDTWVRETITYLQTAYDEDVKKVEFDRDHEADEDTKAILVKRLEVLQRRREFVGKIGKIVLNLSHQLALLEDTFGLISDELLARPPEQVLADIDDVVSKTNTMTQVLEEIAPYERMVSKLAA